VIYGLFQKSQIWEDFKKNRGEVSNLTAARSVGIGRARRCVCIHARPLNGTARCFFPSKHGIDYGSRTTHTWAHAESIDRAVSRASTAFHAGIPIGYINLPICQAQDSMGANK